MGDMVRLAAADGHELDAYRADPAEPPKGGIVVVQEAFGVNRHIRAVCDDYARYGYVALAPALYDRQQPGAAFGYDPVEMERGLDLRRKLDWDKVLLDVDAAIAALRPLRVGMVGYCVGGSVTWLAACRLHIDAAACYYASDIGKQYQDTPRCPVIMHFAERDRFIQAATVAAFRVAHPDVPVHLYPAEHGFNCWHLPDTSYHEPSAKLALARTLALFAQYVARPA
jgi:carboxymethylenebutenolidase